MSKHHETPLGHCLGCLPVRVGVLAFSSLILVLSFCAVAGLVTEDFRILVGGYAPCSNWLVDVLGCLGVVFSLMSIVGVYDNHQQWVRLFAHFATFRVIVRLYVFWADFQMLRSCEKFGVSSVTSRYNPAMEMVTLYGRCSSTRTYYSIISVLDIFLSLYGLWNAYFWCFVVENGPMYHITIDDSKPLRIYTGYSTVGQPEAPPIVTVVPPTEPERNVLPSTMGPSMGYSAAHLAPPPGGYHPMSYGTQQPGWSGAAY